MARAKDKPSECRRPVGHPRWALLKANTVWPLLECYDLIATLSMLNRRRERKKVLLACLKHLIKRCPLLSASSGLRASLIVYGLIGRLRSARRNLPAERGEVIVPRVGALKPSLVKWGLVNPYRI